MREILLVAISILIVSCDSGKPNTSIDPIAFSEPVLKSSNDFRCTLNWLNNIDDLYSNDPELLNCIHEYAPLKIAPEDIHSIYWLPENEQYQYITTVINLKNKTMIYLRVGFEQLDQVKNWSYFRVLAKYGTAAYTKIYYRENQ